MIKKKLGLRLVRSYRSYPFLKQDLGKARFRQKEICERGIKSEWQRAIYADESAKAAVDAICFRLTDGQPECK